MVEHDVSLGLLVMDWLGAGPTKGTMCECV